MSHINKEDRELSKRASGIPDNQHWKKQPTVIHAPSNDRTEIRHRNQHKNPWAKDRVTNNINGYSGKGPTVPATGNPNSNGSVFTQSQSKPQRTQRTSFLKKPGPPGPSRQGFIGKPIDLTKDDAEPVSHSSTVADDSEGSLNLKETEPSSTRIADDGRATKRLRSGEPSKAVGADTETEAIEEFPVQTRKGGKVRGIVHNIDRNSGKAHSPKLLLSPSNPLKPLSLANYKPKARFHHVSITEPTPFTNRPKSKGKGVFVFPLTDWVRGTEHLVEPRKNSLSWGSDQGRPVFKVTSVNEDREFKIWVNSEIQDLQASSDGVSPLIIVYGARSLRRNPGSEPQSGSDVTHGMMAFRVDTEDKDCSQPARKALYEFLRDKCGCREWLTPLSAQKAWDIVLRDLKFATKSRSKERQSPLQRISTTDHRSERHRSVSSHPELPPYIKLSPPPGSEVPLLPKISQKVGQMNRRQVVEEQRETREIVEGEPIAGSSNQPQRRSSRLSTLHPNSSTVDPTRTSPSEDPEELLLVYRPLGAGAVNITRGDLERLQPGKYLNDTLIEFGLKLWLNDLRDCDPELADQIHLFSSFFYKKLAIKDKRAGYESVRKWTSRVDVFSKRYLVVPINEHLHWYLAIIYQPEYTLQPAQPPNSPVTRKRKRDEELSVEPAIEVSESRETPTTTSKPTSKATTEILDGGEIETVPDSEPTSPKMEVEEQTQTDETTKPEEQEVEIQLCADVSSVSLDEHEHEGSDFRKGERDDSVYTRRMDEEGMEIDHSPPRSPMHIDREVHIEDLTRESTPLGTVEPSVIGTEDTTPEALAMEMEGSIDSGPIDPQAFYRTSAVTPRTYGKNKPRTSAPTKLEGGSHGGDLGDVETAPLKTDHTYIFVFDSLNGKHPGAMKNLVQYLRFEATDKKGIDNPSSPEAMAAHVPTQDNYCDCGLYLLHFAKVFMEDPAKSFNTILTKRRTPKADREVDWKKELVGTSREDLTRRILELSEIWVEERAKEAEEKAKAKEREGTSKPESIAVDSPEDSDDDVILEEVVTSKPDPPKKPGVERPGPANKEPAGRGRGRTSSKTETGSVEPEKTAAERFR